MMIYTRTALHGLSEGRGKSVRPEKNEVQGDGRERGRECAMNLRDGGSVGGVRSGGRGEGKGGTGRA